MSFDDIKESAAMAVATVRANKLRSSLTILGVGIGVVTLTFMVSIIQGLNKAFAEQIESLGSNTIFVSKFDPSFGRPPNNEELHRKDITIEDAEAIRHESADTIDSVAPIRRKIAASLRYADKETDTPILFGVTPEYEYTLSQYVERGRFVTEGDLAGRENVAILAQDVVRALFPNEDPLGQGDKDRGHALPRRRRDGDAGELLRPVARQLGLHPAPDLRQVLARHRAAARRLLHHPPPAHARARPPGDGRDHGRAAPPPAGARRARRTTSASRRRTLCSTSTTS